MFPFLKKQFQKPYQRSPVPLLQRLELLSDDGGEGATDDRTGHPVLSQAGGEQVDVAWVVVDAEVGGPTGFDIRVL